MRFFHAIPLAMSEAFYVWADVFQVVWTTVISYAVWRISGWQNENKHLESRLQASSDKHIDDRFTAMADEMTGHVQAFNRAIDEMRLRLKDGDTRFAGIGARDHDNELKTLQAIADLKLYVVENAASKNDLRRHQGEMTAEVNQIKSQLNEQDKSLAVLTARKGNA